MKKTNFIYGIGLFFLSLIGCSSQPFPGGPDAPSGPDGDGTRDVPFIETYLFDFRTGAGPIGRDNPDGNLQVISAADLLTLLAAAQDQQRIGLGVVSGQVLFNGLPVQDVALKVTDADGNLLAIRMEGKRVGNQLVLSDGQICPPENVTFDNICVKGNVYYNSPGGVPDFSNSRGTSIAGSYTIFNLPPGDVYLWAARGGRGTARIKVFANRVSIGKLFVAPIAISTVGVTGSITEAKNESTPVGNAVISVLGSTDPALTTRSDASGLYSIASIGTNGNYLLKVSKSGYWDAYHSLNTLPFQATADVPDVTRSVTGYSNGYIAEIGAIGVVPVDSAKGIITGRIRAGDGTPQHCAKITVTDADGNDLFAAGAVAVYIDDARNSCIDPNDRNQTSTNGLFFVYNLPPGEVFIRYIAKVSTGSGNNFNTVGGGMIASSFPGIVFVQDMINSGGGISQRLLGKVENENATPIGDARIIPLGVAVGSYSYDDQGVTRTFNLSSDAKSDPTGNYFIPKNLDGGASYPLMGGVSYRIKVSKAGAPDTYQALNIGDKETQRDLLLLSMSVSANPGTGEVYGLLSDRSSGRTAENVTLSVTDLSGNQIGGGTIFSTNGILRISNLPPGLINLSVISGDDSGNAIVRVYPNGVTYLEFAITKVIPSQVAVSGKVKDLSGNPVDQTQVRILGRSDSFSSDGGGGYLAGFESFGRFIVKTDKAGFHPTYNFFPRSGVIDRADCSSNPSNCLDLFSVSRAQTGVMAAEAGRSLNGSDGIIVGTTVRSGFVQNICASCLGGGGHAAVLGFFDRDALADIAVTNQSSGTVTVLFGDGAGGFVNPRTVTVGSNPAAIVTEDFDGDGALDLVVANQADHTITVLKGDKNGNFNPITPATAAILDADGQPIIPSPLNAPVALVAGLFDSDSFPDIAVVNQGGGGSGNGFVMVLLGNGNGTFHPVFQNNNPVQNGVENLPKAIVAGDFNQDQRLDMAISNSGSGTVTVLLGSTDGTFQALSDPNSGSPIVLQAGIDPEGMTFADLNSDGRLDLAVLNRSQNALTLFSGNTGGGFDRLTDANRNPLPPVPLGNAPSAISIGEFNGDGRLDLAVVHEADNMLMILFGNGNGTLTPSTPILLGDTDGNGVQEIPFVSPTGVLASDLNRDGLFDLTIVGSHLGSLIGLESPTGGISVEARNMTGARVGEVRYIDSLGHVQPNLTATLPTGGFAILNVPPGLVMVRSVGGGVGNRIVDAFADAVSYVQLRTLSQQPFFVSVDGVTYDPVGPPPAGVPVGSVNIEVLGSDIRTRSDQTLGNYFLNMDANSEYILKLFWSRP